MSGCRHVKGRGNSRLEEPGGWETMPGGGGFIPFPAPTPIVLCVCVCVCVYVCVHVCVLLFQARDKMEGFKFWNIYREALDFVYVKWINRHFGCWGVNGNLRLIFFFWATAILKPFSHSLVHETDRHTHPPQSGEHVSQESLTKESLLSLSQPAAVQLRVSCYFYFKPWFLQSLSFDCSHSNQA